MTRRARGLPDAEVIEGDVREKLRDLPEGSVHCVMTSPPYLGLRDYGTATWEGGDDPACEHSVRKDPKIESSTLAGSKATTGHQLEGFKRACPRCGARRVDNQLGLEEIPDCVAWARGEDPCARCYVCNLVIVFREIWRVLRDDGTCWLVLGDSYSRTGGPAGGRNGELSHREGHQLRMASIPSGCGLKVKDLCMIPAQVAIALRADGWHLRSENVWGKTNNLPESVTDRTTQSTERVFLLTKSPTYFYDAEAIREPRGGNKRDLWLIPTQSTGRGHFATFPEELVETCILAGTSGRGCCASCGAPWDRDRHRGRPTPGARWRPGCRCPTRDKVPAQVLDPFCGSGTTLVVARRLGRHSVGVELNPGYARDARARLAADMPLLGSRSEDEGVA